MYIFVKKYAGYLIYIALCILFMHLEKYRFNYEVAENFHTYNVVIFAFCGIFEVIRLLINSYIFKQRYATKNRIIIQITCLSTFNMCLHYIVLFLIEETNG
jgi:hypothetical protein